MREINVTELRNHLHKYLTSVQKGSEVLITWHGQVIAKLMPPVDSQQEALAQLRKLRKNCKIKDVISPIEDDWEANK